MSATIDDLVDYELTDDLDVQFNEWDDIATIDGSDVVMQNLVLDALGFDDEAGSVSATNLTELASGLASSLESRPYVTTARVTVQSIDDESATLQAIVNTDETITFTIE